MIMVTEHEWQEWKDLIDGIGSNARMVAKAEESEDLANVLWQIVRDASILRVDMHWCELGQEYLCEQDE